MSHQTRKSNVLLYLAMYSSLSFGGSTFFQTANWPMKDSAEPLDGWDVTDVLNADTGPATNDVYGKLFYYVTDLLSSFKRRTASLSVRFEMSCNPAEELGNHLKADVFARIEVSNGAGYISSWFI